MSQKVRKTLIMIVMAALIICLMAASLTYTFTYGRYAGGKFDEESPYDDLIEFVGAREYTVRSPEELIQAIKDGYSNIVIAEDAEEPFVITEGVTDVEANLVLNLNGNVVVRNSRNPMLDVQTNVSVVLVYDSKNTGAFYNPVGSSLMASGGSLTVGSGGYKSGPRAEEYKDGTAAGTLGDTANATLFARSNETNNAVSGPTNLDRSKYVSDYSLVSGVSLPTITPKTTQENNRETVRGNVYLNSDYSDWLPADTFLIYTVEEDCFIGDGTSSGDVKFESGKLYVDAESETVGDNAETETVGDNTTIITASEFTTPLCNVASCDFYYYYPISGTAGTDENPQDYAVIYGYWDVMKLARDDGGAATALKDSGLIYPYGAVRMVEGEGIVRGGTFSNHFDAVNTYGIYAEGGTLSVSKNTTVDTTFTTGDEGVCIRVQSATEETTTTGEATTTGGSLTISGGTFSSEVGNTIEMSGGKMTVTAGKFTKNASSADTNSTNNGSAIDIQGGTLNMTGTEANDVKSVSFDIKGNYVNGIKMEKEESATADPDTIKNAAFSFNKESGQGSGGTSVAAIQVLNGSLNVSDSTFDFNQGYAGTAYTNNGIYVQGGSVNATNCAFSLSPNGSVTGSAAIASAGGKVTAEGCDFEVNGYSNYGVYSLGGEITATDCGFTMTQAGSLSDGRGDNFGIYSTLSENISAGTATANGCTINVTGTYSAGVLSMAGTLNLGASTTKATSITVSFEGNELSSSGVSSEGGEINLTGNTEITSDGLGITARGEVNVTGGTSTVTTARGTGVYVQNGTLNIEQSATVSVESKIDNNCTWVVPPEHQDEDEPLQTNKFNGVFVNGGSLDSKGTLNVTFTGVQNAAYNTETDDGAANTDYLNQQIKSYAVRVEGDDSTSVKIASGTILNGAQSDLIRDEGGNITEISEHNGVGGGILVNGGKVTLGVQNSNSGPTVVTTGTEVGTQVNLGSEDTWTTTWRYWWSLTGGDAVKVVDGSLTIYGGEYRAAQGNGIFVKGGTASEGQAYAVQIQNGTFYGADGGSSAQITGPAASYAIKVADGSVLIKDGTFGENNETTSKNNGAALFMGTSNDNRGTIQVEGGTFGGFGADTIVIYRYANVTLNNAQVSNRGASAVSLTNDVGYDGEDQRGSSVTIKGGSYTGGNDAIWYGCSVDSLSITGGTFTGAARSGLYFEVAPTSGGVDHVTLSGGTYHGSNGAINAENPGSISTGDIIARGAYCFTQSVTGQADENKEYAICKREYNISIRWNYYHVGGNGGNENVDLNDNTYVNGGNEIRFNERGTIFISNKNGKVSDYTGSII